MSIHVKTGVADLLDQSIPDRSFYLELVRALYGTPKSIFSATIAALIIMGLSHALSGDPAYLVLFTSFAIVGTGRSGLVILYHHSPHNAADFASIKRWEL